MDAGPVHIIQYFDGSKQGVIPLFQRPYSWDQGNWGALWDDVMAQYDDKEPYAHFMGAVVTVPVKSVPVGVAKHLVIDGQQRLTTISILLAAIREQAANSGDFSTEGIVGDLLTNRHYKDPDDLKLVPTQADRAAYNALVNQKDKTNHEESKIIQAYRFFLKKLRGKDDEGNEISPVRILQTIQQTLQVVMINLSESDDPYLIFESLNHKGKPLSQADLVRNYVLMQFKHSTDIGGEQEAVYNDYWQPMESNLDESMADFLRHFLMRNGENVRKGEIYISSKKEFLGLNSSDEVRSKLLEMKQSSVAYRKFLNPSEENNTKISRRLDGIQSLDQKAAYPLLLRLYRNWEQQFICDTDLVECLDLLESFFVRRSICAVPTNSLNKLLLELCQELPPSAPHAWLRRTLLDWQGNRRWPTNEEFADAMINQRIYERPRIARYVLVALEEAHKHKELVDTASATIEHVMPQTLTNEWRAELGTDHESVHERWLDTIGNLTLTSYNSELANSAFHVKKTLLANTHFELTRWINQQDKWGAQQIETRGKLLAEMALERWGRD
ncbi:DUF262 domain-containing protein [Pseudomonas simiae]|uniref:DUF262 domain-containing protein n=1 Tax=Pseudomonas simiae TaxID=321846 RepID=UPI0005C40E5B|nr:DUF262 domain-containing protein [Pseudomonas simiae]AJP55057.1 hypothetical protein PF1751_v1c53650 [Pseudomonas simiae]